jgi:hypothetical protein
MGTRQHTFANIHAMAEIVHRSTLEVKKGDVRNVLPHGVPTAPACGAGKFLPVVHVEASLPVVSLASNSGHKFHESRLLSTRIVIV